MLELHNVSKYFNNKKILDHITLSAKPGSITLILGPSGVGKSTLLRAIAGLEPIDEGRILLDGHDLHPDSQQIKKLKKAGKQVNRGSTVGMVFQHFNLFDHMTVVDNIIFPLVYGAGLSRADAQERAHILLKQYGLEDKAQVYAHNLSGGQKQRLALARSVAPKPRIICLDEPTSALDPSLTSSVARSIQELAQSGYIVLISSHDTSLIKLLPVNMYLLYKGKIIEHATARQFHEHPEKYPQLNTFIAGNEGA